MCKLTIQVKFLNRLSSIHIKFEDGSNYTDITLTIIISFYNFQVNNISLKLTD